ncbi:PREDICTED: B-box zinc finger protein 32-like [Populus euphratica]|uniref:B-box zinc finger protein 32-like n=1 Tax=Populus euphratica TaxID=75702 RepID=A0AAJ6XVR4_POPEU|nr:PREDICTED: B-box zinc finger protein 32-like [Populus euphratica]
MAVKVCELCQREAVLYCDSDAAFLCFECDSNVHNANFVVSRHLRRVICSACNSLTGSSITGTAPSLRRVTCLSCSPENKELDSISCSSSCSSTLSSACISTTETTRFENTRKDDLTSCVTNIPARFSGSRLKRSRNLRSECVFVNWCQRLGLNGNLVVKRASRAMALCFGGLVLPFRVRLAASFWFGVRSCGDKSVTTWQDLRRLEEVSGVPRKMISAVEMKIKHALRSRRLELHKNMEEGWADSTDCSA